MISSDGLSPSKETPKTRFATAADEERILEMSRAFFAASPYRSVQFNDESVRVLIRELMATGCIILSEHGFIAGALTPLFFAPHVLVATEIAWWAPDEGGLYLREAFEQWGKDNGASAVEMSTLNDESASRLANNLTRNGYSPLEVHYLKAL